MINKREKDLYNLYLIVSRSSRNLPFKLKQNFDDFDNTPNHLYVKKICNFLLQFPQINPTNFFKAPYMIYTDVEHIGLNFYITQKAITAYTLYMKQIQEESPDSNNNIEFIKNSLKFIGMFCIKNKISIDDYLTYATGITYSWMKHIKEHNISIYVMFIFPNIIEVIQSTPKDELDLLLGSIATNIQTYNNRYDTSKTAKHIVKEGFERVKRVVNKSIKK